MTIYYDSIGVIILFLFIHTHLPRSKYNRPWRMQIVESQLVQSDSTIIFTDDYMYHSRKKNKAADLKQILSTIYKTHLLGPSSLVYDREFKNAHK